MALWASCSPLEYRQKQWCTGKQKQTWNKRCTHTHQHKVSQTNIFLWSWITCQSRGGRLSPSNKHIIPINSNSLHWPVTGTKLNVNTPLHLFHHAVDCRRTHSGKQHTPFIRRCTVRPLAEQIGIWEMMQTAAQSEAAWADLLLHLWDSCFQVCF